MTQARWLTLDEAAALHGVSLRTMQRWARQGLRTARVGRRRVTRSEWVDEFLLAHVERPVELSRAWRAARLALVCAVAVAVGGEIEEAWAVRSRPLGFRIDSVAGIVAAVVLVLVAERSLLDPLWWRAAGRLARARARRDELVHGVGERSGERARR